MIRLQTFIFFFLYITLSFLPAENVNAQRIVFLGNIPEKTTLPLDSIFETAPDAVLVMGEYERKDLENQHANATIQALSHYTGKLFWIPGEKVWGNRMENPSDQLAAFKEEVNDMDTSWIVPGCTGCPGPEVYELSDQTVLIVLNTPWWFFEGDKPSAAECGLEDMSGFFVELNELLRQYDKKRVILVGHHPLTSRGPHSGYFPWTVHLTPPIFGSIYAGYRKLAGSIGDLTNINYKSWSDEMTEVLVKYPDVVYCSSHEKAFQYIQDGGINQIIIGDLLKKGYAKDKDAVVDTNPGFTVLQVDKKENMSLDFVSKTNQHILLPTNATLPELKETAKDTFPATVSVKATSKLGVPGKRPGLMGNNYRAEWNAVIRNVPVFRMDTVKGGLKIVKRGGGQQTRSLRLEAKNEKQYVLRSIEKFPEKAVPVLLRNTLAADLIADQISASHPYGALVIPPLADAAGVYHTNPQLYYLPDDPALGKYREDFANGLYLFEERPDDDWRDLASFGNSKKIISTSDLLEKLQNDGDHIVMQEQTVRSRLFDIWIGDWDRHDDQWRWARYKKNDIKYYAPIPRDRDQTFFWSDGSLIKLISHKWGQPKFQGFHEKIRDVDGLPFNARYFDRTFLVGAERDIWIKMAHTLQDHLTDEIIEKAIADFPPEIYDLHGKDIIRKLKQRRDDLVEYADEYYHFLAKAVTITGSDKEDLFQVTREKNGAMKVEVSRISGKTNEKKYTYYSRTFLPEETDEVQLFALGDDDRVEVYGSSDKSPLLRVIGGKGDDLIDDKSHVRGLKRKTVVYDKMVTPVFSVGEVREKLSDRAEVNAYNRYSFKYDKLIPLLDGGYNPDDGVFLGGGAVYIKHGFRKEPYAQRHSASITVAPYSGSYGLTYEGEFVDAVGPLNVKLNAVILEPNYAGFFYGNGNQSAYDKAAIEEDHQYYRSRFSFWNLTPELEWKSRSEKHTLSAGLFLHSVKVGDEDNEDNDRFIIDYADLIERGEGSDSPLLNTRRIYTGFTANYSFDLRDQEIFPKRGVYFHAGMTHFRQLGDEKKQHQRYRSEISLYLTLWGSLRTTIATRVGAEWINGDYEFYQSANLGGLSRLRGYRRQRFAGDRSFYHNLDIRIKLFDFKTILFPGEFGILLLHDIGKVWSDQTDITLQDPGKAEWHRGIGGGIWISPLGKAIISADYAMSNDDEKAFFIRLGFMF